MDLFIPFIYLAHKLITFLYLSISSIHLVITLITLFYSFLYSELVFYIHHIHHFTWSFIVDTLCQLYICWSFSFLENLHQPRSFTHFYISILCFVSLILFLFHPYSYSLYSTLSKITDSFFFLNTCNLYFKT